MVRIEDARTIWNAVLEENRGKLETSAPDILEKLKRVDFRPGGELKTNRYGLYAIRHFPALLREYKRRLETWRQGELFRSAAE